MAPEQSCPICGTSTFPDSLEGLCPKCVGRAVFGDYSPVPPELNEDDEADLAEEIEGQLHCLKPEEAGERIGNYRLLERLGHGGFGVVWVAEQERPIRRRVAFKIIKLGMDTREFIARFEQERQALAMMEHPNIAKVFDAGATEWGRPFFAMEMVHGTMITEYCDEARLSIAERLRLFIQVCEAVQHAHQKGIIHRDLKPSNVLVTLRDGMSVPKVIDFGVAKATQRQRLTDLTLYTGFQQMIGTPLYMSPEQAEMGGLDIDTRSDIYSLGVLLYELLTGRTPFDPEELMRHGIDEIRRVIREQDPQTPSGFLKTMPPDQRKSVADHRRSDPAKLTNLLRGDLDWILMKALEKDRARRYATAIGLAKDIERHLASEPVLARPASPLYRFRRLVRRNRVAAGATVVIACMLLAGICLSTWAFLREQEQRQESDKIRLRENRLLYASDMSFAQQALRIGNVGRAQRNLDLHRPAPGQQDLRGWEWRYLWQQCRSDSPSSGGARELPRHLDSVRALPGGQHIIGKSKKYGMSLLHLDTLHETPLLANPAADARFAPPKWIGIYDGERLEVSEITPAGLRPVGVSTIGREFTIFFAYSAASGLLAWSPGPGRVCVAQLGKSEKVDLLMDDKINHPVRFSHNGQALLVTNETGAVRVWDMATQRRLPAAERYFSPYDFTLNAYNSVRGRSLTDWMSAATSPAVLARREPARGTPPPDFWPPGVWNDRAFSPDGRTSAVAAASGVFGLYDNVEQRRLKVLNEHLRSVYVLAFSADGTRLASVSSREESVKLWDVASGRELLTLATDEPKFDAAEFSDDNSTLIIGNAGKYLYWRVPSWEQIAEVERRGGGWAREE